MERKMQRSVNGSWCSTSVDAMRNTQPAAELRCLTQSSAQQSAFPRAVQSKTTL